MQDSTQIKQRIKDTVFSVDPTATVILFGSYARGEEKDSSDFDLLILIDKNPITRNDVRRIKYPLYDIEFETGQIISPLILSKSDWESKHSATPFYENVSKEGIFL